MLVTVDQRRNLVRVDPLPPGLVKGIAVSPDGAWLVVEYGAGGQARLLPLAAAQRPSIVPSPARGYAFSPDARFVAVAVEGRLRIVDLRTLDWAELANVDATAVAWTH